MSKVIAVFNQKGGVGKTTTNVNLTASLGSMGKKILVLDLDPQGNTTSGYGIDKQSVERTIYDVIIEGVEINEAILSTEFDNIDIVASDTDLAGCEIELTSRESREYILKNSIDKVRDNYDYILEGNLEIDKLLNKLIEEEYDGLISIESHLPMIKDDNKVEMFNRSIENIRKWLKEVI